LHVPQAAGHREDHQGEAPSQRQSFTCHCPVRDADDVACIADGSVPDLGVIAHQSLLGRVQATSTSIEAAMRAVASVAPFTKKTNEYRACGITDKNEIMAIACDYVQGLYRSAIVCDD